MLWVVPGHPHRSRSPPHSVRQVWMFDMTACLNVSGQPPASSSVALPMKRFARGEGREYA